MLNYIIQVILFQVLFLLVYDLFLSKETFFAKNRWYLIGTAMLSFVLPLLKIERLQKAVSEEYTVLLPEVVLSPQKVIEKTSWYQSVDYISVLFWAGVAVFSIIFIIKLTVVLKLIFTNEIRQKETHKLVLLPKTTKAFSFFNYIFLGKEIPKEKQEKIIQHELVHSQQKHSLDLLFFELLKIVMWFNPMLYVYQKRITLVHEFISDDIVSKSVEKNSYINNLLSEVFQVEHISFINQFYKHSFIKKRIIMMTKTKSKQIKQLKYLLLVPVLASMLFYTSCSKESAKVEVTKEVQTRFLETKEELISKKGDKETYLDMYLGFKRPEWEKIKEEDLSEKELLEYKETLKRGKDIDKYNDIELYKQKSGRKVIAYIYNFKKYFANKPKAEIAKDGSVPFSAVEKAPTFPNCNEGDKDCLNKSMRKFVVENFKTELTKNLGLSAGKKRIYIQFKINKNGDVTDIKARAPHPKLKEEAIRIAKALPKLIPAEQKGKKVSVGYTLPITFNVE